ncbi:sensor histidine kinase [Arenibaculum sp.]|uniref:sensor histidine kinase n=1 Tax=Arenibaculum sp. TaxID=2865862 RepID=UPI002E1456C4|nr:histidine kinase dimerization/phosphoacceptor domain -containing protein [Arenibaculum sp.]
MTESSDHEREIRLEQQTALARFGDLALRSEDLDEILGEGCRLVATGLRAECAKMMELRPDGASFLIRAGVGWKPGVVGHAVIGAGHRSAAGLTVQSRQPIVSPDLDLETRFEVSQLLRDHGIRSSVNVTVEVAGTGAVYGVLEVDARAPRHYTDDDISFLHTHANLIGAAVGRMCGVALLRDAVAEKQRLLMELQHRVKNNLQVITSLVRIRTRRAQSQEARDELHALGERIEALRLVHDKLHVTGTVDWIDLGGYVGELVSALFSFNGERVADVRLEVETVPLDVAPEKAIPLGLIVTEFITNSIKHAFDGGPGLIRVEIVPDGRKASLVLHDNGKGTPENGPASVGSGMQLIDGLARQIGAELRWERGTGTRLVLEFSPG